LRLDAHHSFTERYPLSTLASILKRNRFDGSVLVVGGAGSQPVASGSGTRLVSTLPEFIRAFVIETARIDARLLDQYQLDPRFRGVCCGCAQGLPEGLEELERRNLTVDVVDGLPLVPAMAERFGGLRIAIDYLGSPAVGSPSEAWASALEAAARIPQVCCKLSGLTGRLPKGGPLGPSPPGVAPEPGPIVSTPMGTPEGTPEGGPPRSGIWKAEDLRPYVRHALAVFGPGRLMFGSGWPEGLPEHTWKESLAVFTQSIGAQTIEVREQLLGGTAARFYGIA